VQVFLSSTYRDLIEHRRRVADAIDRLGHRILRMETFGARPEEATAASLSDVDACDIFIGVYGHRYGLIPEGSSFSITELEFDHACEKGKPILAFIVDLDYDCPEDGIEAEPEKSRLGG